MSIALRVTTAKLDSFDDGLGYRRKNDPTDASSSPSAKREVIQRNITNLRLKNVYENRVDFITALKPLGPR